MLDVPLHIYDAGTKSYRETSTNDGLVLDVNCESACGAICAQMVDKRRQIAAAAQLDKRASVLKITAVETLVALGAHEVVEIWRAARSSALGAANPGCPRQVLALKPEATTWHSLLKAD